MTSRRRRRRRRRVGNIRPITRRAAVAFKMCASGVGVAGQSSVRTPHTGGK